MHLKRHPKIFVSFFYYSLLGFLLFVSLAIETGATRSDPEADWVYVLLFSVFVLESENEYFPSPQGPSAFALFHCRWILLPFLFRNIFLLRFGAWEHIHFLGDGYDLWRLRE